MHASVANQFIKRAQLVAGGLGVLAVAAVLVPMGAFGASGRDDAAPVAQAKPVQPGKGGLMPSYAPFTAALDTTRVAADLSKIAPVVPVTRPRDDGPKLAGAEVVAPPPPPPPPPWRYIGSVFLGADRRAFVVVTDKQQLVGVGDTVEGSKLKTIEAEYLLVTDAAGAEKRVDLAPRQTRALSVLESAQASSEGRSAMNESKGGKGSEIRGDGDIVALMSSMLNGEMDDESLAQRLKSNESSWQKQSEQLRDPNVRKQLDRAGNSLVDGTFDPVMYRRLTEGQPRIPQLIELEDRFYAGQLDQATFTKLAHQAYLLQQERAAQAGLR